MTIEEALEIINNTNFTNEKQEEAFDMATTALVLFEGYKRDIKVLERTKGDHLAQAIVNCFKKDIEILEGSGDNGKQ